MVSGHMGIILYGNYISYIYVKQQGFSSMLQNSPMFVNIVFNSLVEYQDSKPILNLSVNEFLWGYDDKLVKMASSVLPTWINFAKFGLLDRVIVVYFNTFILPYYLLERMYLSIQKYYYNIRVIQCVPLYFHFNRSVNFFLI